MTATPNLIAASASSVVRSVEVERGDTVSKGQIVAYLDDTVAGELKTKSGKDRMFTIDQLNMEQSFVDRPNELKPTDTG